MNNKVHCYAEGRGGAWEAFCLNFDLAVQGASLEEVRCGLDKAIRLYLDYVSGLPAGERAAFLGRRAPVGQWLKYGFIRLCSLAGTRSKRRAEGWAERRANTPA